MRPSVITVNRLMWMSLRVLACLLGLLLGAERDAHGQLRPLNYRVFSTMQGAVGGSTPFWHYANARGQFRPGATADWVSGASLTLPFQENGGLDVSVGAKAVSRISDATNTLHFLHLYGKAQYRGLRLSVGRFPETIGATYPPLSMGSMIVSRNAPPVPKIKLFTPDYVDVPFTDGYVQVRGRWSDGVLGVDRTVERARLHQKTFYLKVNVGPLAASGGLIQNTTWGGKGQSNELIDYLHLFVGSQAGTENDPNRVGNTIAAYDFALQYTLDDWQVRASRLFYLEDTVSMRFRSPWDGMWGLSLQRTNGHSWINGLLYEHMNTIKQDSPPGVPRGRAGYYTHHIYESGWTYQGTVLGNPLIVFSPEQNQVVNNMIIAHHLGIRGTPTPRLGYKARLTYSRNYGVCADQIVTGACHIAASEPVPPNQKVRPRGELREDQYSVFVEVRYRLSEAPGLQLVGSTAVDVGEFYEDRWGIRIGLRWSGSIPTP
ncbi:MAG: capsule assembly Wzi family protein [Salinibacter sp.]